MVLGGYWRYLEVLLGSGGFSVLIGYSKLFLVVLEGSWWFWVVFDAFFVFLAGSCWFLEFLSCS